MKPVVPKRVSSQPAQSRTLCAKRVRLASEATILASPPCAVPQHSYDPTHSYDEVRVEALVPPGGNNGMRGDDPKPGMVGRRTALLAVATMGVGAVVWASSTPELFPEESTVVTNTTGLSVAEARVLCEEAAATCSTLYSQMSSTLRMQQGGFMDDDLFQATCVRRLGSPYILESFNTLQDAVPVLGASLAYTPRTPTNKSILTSFFNPTTVPVAQTAAYESLTLTAVQRCRRVARVLKFMAVQGYTHNGLELMLNDLRALMGNLDQVLAEVPV